MKLGKKKQRGCPKKRRWRNIINIKNMLVTLMMSLVIATILIVIPKIGTPHNARDILEKKRFVFVQNPKFIESRGEDYGKGFDLGENAFF